MLGGAEEVYTDATGKPRRRTKNGTASMGLGKMAATGMWPTPAYSQMAKPVRPLSPSEEDGTHGTMLVGAVGDACPELVGGSLNPTWVEWLMGFPIGWTDLGP